MARLAPAVAALTFLMPIAGTVGASPSPPLTLDITSRATSWLPVPPKAPYWGLAPDEHDLVFSQGGAGFLISSPSVVPTGAGSVAEVQRTLDQGERWGTVWRRTGASVSWIGAVGTEVIAAGISLERAKTLPSRKQQWRCHLEDGSGCPQRGPGLRGAEVLCATGTLFAVGV